ncbi:NUDIX domain-containing protein [Candidatus Roizmanbacteria bacterium]|nr:NUDIX domain-containing protein [Candidatus Roizmanbacteria bacterium]
MKAGIDIIGVTTAFYCHDGVGNFVLHKRSNKCRDEQGVWDNGGGKLEYGLTLEENVLKELKEELGCDGRIQEQLPSYSLIRNNNGQKTHWIAIPFIILVNPNEVKNNDPEKIAELGWFKLSHLPYPLHPGLKIVLSNYQKYLEKYK